MALVKVVLTVVLFLLLNYTKTYWYFLISWFVNYVIIASISWWLARKITRDILCKEVFPRVDPTGKAVLITGLTFQISLQMIVIYLKNFF